MIGKKINQLATELAPVSTDLTIIGDPISGVSKKITLAQLGAIFSGAVSFYTNLAGFPATGDINVIYCAKDTQKLYLWSGSAYTEVFPSQALLDTYQLRSEKGVSNGYASLDSGGKVPISQLPSSIMEYKGTWNAATNTPTLANGTGDTGDVYICNVAGTVNFGAGAITFAVGDYVIYSGTIWQRSSGAVGTVTSVAASITGNAIGITGSPVTTSGTLAFAFAGTGAQYIKGDGTLATFPNTISQAEKLITEVYNSTGATLTKGTIVYINGGQGNLPTVTKALATGDSTSAQTFGVVQADITNMNNGYVVVAGKLSDLDTQAYTPGTQLYLSSTTAGTWTSTKQYAPNHLVYIGIVVRAHPTQGIVEIKIQNGYELDELHDVAAQTPTNNDGLFWEASTSLWKNKSIATILGGTPVTGSGTIYALTKWGFASGTIINSNLYDTGTTIYNNNATSGSFAVQFNGNATSGMSYGLLINAGTNENDIAFRVQNVSSTSEYFFVYGDGKVKINNIPNATTDTDTFLVSDGGYIKYRTGAQLLSDIGGQAALTNPVTGTGTTNYLPKFTGTSSIGNSGIQTDASGNIGLNVTPTNTSNYTKLQVSGTTGGIFDLLTGSTRHFTIYNGSSNSVIGTVTNTPLIFQTNDSTKMTLDASGNLGLGVNPSAWGSGRTAIQLKGSSTAVYFAGEGNTVLSNNYYFDTADRYIANGFSTQYLQGASGQHAWYIAPSGTAGGAISYTQAMTLNASGNLSIGNTNDTYKLDVSGTGRFTGSVYSEDVNAYLLNQTGNTTDTKIWSIQNLPTSGQFRIRALNDAMTNGINAIVISRTGISSLSLDFTGAATFSSSVTATELYLSTSNGLIGNINSSNANGGYITWQTSGTIIADIGTANQIFGSGGSDVFGINGRGARAIAFGTNNTERMRITSGGNVGIGTTSPADILDVTRSSASNSTGGISLTNTDNSGYGAALNWNLKLNSTAGVWGRVYVEAASSTATFMSFQTTVGGTLAERMRINSAGNVGIGTTSPDRALTVNGQIGINNDFVSTKGGQVFRIGYEAYTSTGGVNLFTEGAIPLVLGTSSTERMRITSGGVVCVGSTSATYGEIFKAVNTGSSANTALFYFDGAQDRANIISRHGGSTGTTNRQHIVFLNSTGGGVGDIVANGTSTSYNTTSDYRLKTDFKDFNGLDLVSKIKTYDYEWKENKSRSYGVIAHELQSVINYAVTGVKDGEQMQGVDYSKIVPVLIKAIQELNDKIK